MAHARAPLAAASVAMLVAVSGLSNNTIQWSPLGEPACGGDITAVRVNPYNTSQVFIAGDMLGVGISVDGGKTWLAPSPESFLSWEMADFSFDPVLGRVYVASLSGPYYATFADPFTWTSVRTGFPAPSNSYEATTQKVLIDPSSAGQRLLAFGGNKRGWPRITNLGIVWESLDAGGSWAVLANISAGANILFADWCGPDCIWAAAVGAGMFRSDDAGRTWVKRSTGLPASYNFAYAAAHPTDPDTAYVAACDGSGVWKTTNGGQAWTAASSGLPTGQCFQGFGLAPSDPSTIYVGSYTNQGNAWVSTDGAASWQPTGAPPAAQAYGLGLQASFLSVHPADPKTVLYATWVTLWMSADGGASWHDATAYQPNVTDAQTWVGTGFSGLVSTNVKFNPYSAPGHAPGRGFLQGMDAGKIWASAEGYPGAWRRQYGLQEFGGGSDVTFGANGTLYAATGQWGWSLSAEGIVRSDDGGDTWTYACSAPNVSGQPKLAWSVYTVPGNTSSLWAVFADSHVYFSEDGCSSWRLVQSLNDTVYMITAAPATSSDPREALLFAAGQAGVWVSGPPFTPAGLDSWVLLAGSPTAWQYSTNWCTLSPSDAALLVCANAFWDQWHSGLWHGNLTQAAAYLHTGSGPTGWDRVYTDSTIYRWAEAPGSGGAVQAIASNENPYPEVSPAWGILLSVDGGRSWTAQNLGLRMRRVAALAFSPDGSSLIAGLNGGGFYVANTTELVRAAAGAAMQA